MDDPDDDAPPFSRTTQDGLTDARGVIHQLDENMRDAVSPVTALAAEADVVANNSDLGDVYNVPAHTRRSARHLPRRRNGKCLVDTPRSIY